MTFSKLLFSKFKNFFSRSVIGELQLSQISMNFKLIFATKKLEVGEQNREWLFNYFDFERNYDVLKSKSSFFLLKKNINFNKSKMESKMQNPTHDIRETKPWRFSSYKKRKLKAKLWWFVAWEGKIREFFVPFIFSEGNFFNICVLSQCIEYWMHF